MRIKAALVASAPAPYREKVYEIVNSRVGGGFHVVYATGREPNRLWNLEEGNYGRSFLKKSFIPWRGRYIHVNLDVWKTLNRLSPEVVITTGFNPTYLFAYLWARRNKAKHIIFMDGWKRSEDSLTKIHFWVREKIYRNTQAFVGIGLGPRNLDMYRQYGCPEPALFLSQFCADNEYYRRFIGEEKKFDIIFSGQIIKRKMPGFFVEVARLLKEKKPALKALIVGDGPDREEMLKGLSSAGVDFHFAGFSRQEDLPRLYASSRIFLFPTLLEPWGVVANEALAAGVPVITCHNAGAGGDLVIHGENGYVLDLDPVAWRDHALALLENEELRLTFSKNGLEKVREFNYEHAADGLVRAMEFALKSP